MIDLLVAAVIGLTPIDPIHDCTTLHPCYNGHQPSYNDPDCWPGAIYCPPAQNTSYGQRRHHRKGE